MKYIEKKSVAPIPPASGAVSDTWNVENKKTNAPSMSLVEELHTYSTEETKIGTWINGKTIYRKVIKGTIPNNVSIVQIDLTADTLIKDDISYISSSGFKVNRGHTEEGIVQFDSTLNPNGNLYFSTLSNDAKGKMYTLIVEYTKTTD